MKTIKNSAITVYCENGIHFCCTPLGEQIDVNTLTRVTDEYGETPIVLMRNFCNIASSKKEAMDNYKKEGTNYPERINSVIKETQVDTNLISDGYHTFGELYEFRKMFNACLFNEWAAHGKYSVHKSYRHSDGEFCFGGGWFIVVANLPTGQISNHYQISDWELFKIPETEMALFEFDGHTATDVLSRLKEL